MLLVEGPWRHNNSKGEDRSKQTESKRQFDILFEEANKEGNGLLLSISIFWMIRHRWNDLPRILPIELLSRILPIFDLQSPTRGRGNQHRIQLHDLLEYDCMIDCILTICPSARSRTWSRIWSAIFVICVQTWMADLQEQRIKPFTR